MSEFHQTEYLCTLNVFWGNRHDSVYRGLTLHYTNTNSDSHTGSPHIVLLRGRVSTQRQLTGLSTALFVC